MYLGERRFVSEERDLHTGHQEQLFVCDWLSPLSLSATERVYSEGDHSMDDGLLVLSAVHKMSRPHRCGVCSAMDVLLTLRRPLLLGSLKSSIHKDGTSNHTGRSSASKRIPCHPQVSYHGQALEVVEENRAITLQGPARPSVSVELCGALLYHQTYL